MVLYNKHGSMSDDLHLETLSMYCTRELQRQIASVFTIRAHVEGAKGFYLMDFYHIPMHKHSVDFLDGSRSNSDYQNLWWQSHTAPYTHA